jgi:hypothetical protein
MGNKKYTVPNTNISLDSNLFAADRPFENYTNRSFGELRTRRSPRVGAGQFSMDSHIRNRDFYWFGGVTTGITFQDYTGNSQEVDVTFTIRHKSGATALASAVLTTSFSVGPNGNASTSFSSSSLSGLIMDQSGGADLDIVVDAVGNHGDYLIEIFFGGYTPSGITENATFNTGNTPLSDMFTSTETYNFITVFISTYI